jgi:hypothetical protein
MKNLSQDTRSPGRDLNPGPPEYEAGSANHSSSTFGERDLSGWYHSENGLLAYQLLFLVPLPSQVLTRTETHCAEVSIPD